MITVEEADNIIAGNLNLFPVEKCHITKAHGKILREDLLADRDAPPFHRVAMDGIAIKESSWEKGHRNFFIQETQRAGEQALILKDDNYCIEVMTGAVLPEGCDCVIKVEDLTVKDNIAIINDGLKLEKMNNIHLMASDHKQGDILVNRGTKLLSTHIAVAASVGKVEITVAKSPGIAIISTGDELVDVDQDVKPFQIRMSNSYAIQAALKQADFERVSIFHIPDDQKILADKLTDILESFEVLILSGGVSMGKFDYIPAVLSDLGVQKKFHKISQKPGKPFWFGVSSKNKPVFALPGNPVSTLVCFQKYILPNLEKAMGIINIENGFAMLSEEIKFSKPLTNFLPVKINNEQGKIIASPIRNNGSGDYASLVNSDGFIELHKDKDIFPEGSIIPLYKWKG